MYIVYLYLFPFLISILLLLMKFKKIKKTVLKLKDMSDSERKAELDSIFKSSEKLSKSIEELQNEKIFILSRLSKSLECLFFLFVTPIFCLRMVLISIFGSQITWQMPVSLYEVWSLFFLGISFEYASTGNIWLSIALSGLIIMMYINKIIDDFRVKSGSISYSKLPDHKLRIGELLEFWFIVSIGFASLYYAISIHLNNSFSEPLTVFSSMYFSIVTVSTVGFGDITPLHWIPRAVVIIQIVIGFIYTVLLVSIFVSIWSSRFSGSFKDDGVKSTKRDVEE